MKLLTLVVVLLWSPLAHVSSATLVPADIRTLVQQSDFVVVAQVMSLEGQLTSGTGDTQAKTNLNLRRMKVLELLEVHSIPEG